MPRPDSGRLASSTRTLPRILPILAGVFFAARLVLAFVEKPHAGGNAAGGDGKDGPDLVHWVIPDSAEIIAAQSGKPILYDFSAAWCGPCKAMHKEIFSDDAASTYINETFVPSRVVDRAVEDGHNTPITDALQKKYKIAAFPTLVVVTSGREPTTLEGYGGKESLAQLKAAVP